MVERRARVLLAWEFGAGRTHAMNLLGVARKLGERGADCLASLVETRFAPEFAAYGIPTTQSFVWPTRRGGEAGWRERPVASFSDVLANLGFADPPTLGACIAHYDALFALFRPDLVLAENAFGAVAAARGRVPAIALGTASTLPPVEGDGFARRLDGPDALAWPLDDLRLAINRALRAHGRPELGAMADLLRDVDVMPYGPAAFDIYAPQRREAILPPHLPDLPRPLVRGEGEGVFAYIHGHAQTFRGVMEGLAAIGSGTGRERRIHMPGIAPETAAALERHGWRVLPAALPLPELLGTSRCVIHHGGPQLTAACLAAGIAQVLLPKELDNELSAHFVTSRRLGVGRHIALADGAWLANAALRVADSDAIRARCRAEAPRFLDWIRDDPADIVARRAWERLGVPV